MLRGAAIQNWSQQQADARNTGRGTGRGSVGRIRWRARVLPLSDGPVVGRDGTLYLTAGGSLRALSPRTGRTLWRVPKKRHRLYAFVPGLGPGGLIFVTTLNGLSAASTADGLSAISLARRREIWHRKIPGAVSSPAVAGDVLLMTSLSGRLIRVHERTGAIEWQTGAHAPCVARPAIEAGLAYYSTIRALHAVDVGSGRERWHFDPHYPIMASPAVGDDGTVYIFCDDTPRGSTHVFALDGSGHSRWHSRVPSASLGVYALGANGLLYVGCRDGKLYALSQRTGAIQWSFRAQGALMDDPAVAADGMVILGSRGGRVYALDGKTGRAKWTLKAGGKIASPVTINQAGRIYVVTGDVTRDQTLLCIN